MERPFALFALVLALLPWASFFYKPSSPRVLFAPFALLTTRKARARILWKRVLLATIRSLLIVALVLLWANPRPDVKPAKNAAEARRLPKRVLIVDGSDSGPSRQVESAPSVAEYLTWALEGSDLRVDSLESARLASSSLRAYDAIVLADVSVPTSAELDALERFVQDDRRFVLIWVGGRTVPERWNDAWARLGFDARTTRRENLSAKPRRRELATPFSRDFPDASNARLDALTITEALETSGNDVAPLLVDSATGTNVFARVAPGWYWFGASPEPRAGSLALAPYFTTLVDKALEYPSRDFVATPTRKRFDPRPALWVLLTAGALAEIALVALWRKNRA